MTTDELDALAERIKRRLNERYDHPVWGKQGLYLDENVVMPILAAIQQAKTDREEVERLTINAATARGANDSLRSINRRLRLRHDPSCGALQESEVGEPRPCNCFQSMMIQNGQLRAENERLREALSWTREGHSEGCICATCEDVAKLLAARPAAAKEVT